MLQLVPTKDPAIRGASYEETPRWAERVERRDLPYGHWVPLSHPEVVAERGRAVHPLDRLRSAVHA